MYLQGKAGVAYERFEVEERLGIQPLRDSNAVVLGTDKATTREAELNEPAKAPMAAKTLFRRRVREGSLHEG